MKTRLLRAALLSIFVVGAVGACGVPSATLQNDGNGSIDGPSTVDAPIDAAGPPAMLSGAPSSDTAFGDALVGSSTTGVTYTITNDGDGTSGTIAIAFDDATLGFSLANDTCSGQTLVRRKSCTFDVKFAPTVSGAASTKFHVTATPGGEVARMVSGNGLTPGAINIVEASYPFNNLAVDGAPVTHVFDIVNTGQAAIGMPVPTISGDMNSYFVAASTCTMAMLGSGAHCSVTVRFDPTTVGDKPAALTVTSAGGGQDVATLSGTGVANVKVVKAGSGTGSIKSSQTGLDCGTTCPNQAADFSSSPITLNATADPGSTFVAWTGDCTGSGSCTLDLVGAKTVTATFTAITPTLTVTKTGLGSGTVTSDVAGISCGGTCSHSYPFNTMVTLTAAPASGSTFGGWGGACSGTGTCMVTMDMARDVTATFDSVTPTLNVTLAGAGTGVVTSPSGINCGATCTQSYSFGTVVTLTAAPNAGSTFTGWSGTGAGSCAAATTCMLTMNQARDVTATFDKVTPSLTVTKAGGGLGMVTASTGVINCGATCTDTFPFGTMVTLTAAPMAGSSFSAWSGTGAGGCNGSTATTCTLTMDQSRAVTATFTTVTPKLTIVVNGAGTGTVTPSPAGTSCGAGCSTYTFGQMVTLTAAASGTSNFTGWSGVDSGTCAGTATPTCMVTMDQARTITATFDLQTPTLNVTLQGTGAGTVVSNPAGINCTTGTCTKTYTVGTVVMLTATPNAGSTFAGWTGACTGTGACSVTMNSGNSVFATFTAITPPINLTVDGTGTGSVSSSPAGITACTKSGGTCTANFTYNQSVTLTATATGGSTFFGWSGTGSGACNGSAVATCTLPMSMARDITATFTAGQQTLTVTLAGTGTGNVTASAGTLSCPGTCSALYNFGTMLTLTATPTGGASFTGWSGTGAGTCTGMTGTCMVTMDQARALTATFAAGNQTLSVTTSGTGAGTVTSSVGGISCANNAGTCSTSLPYNTVVALTATPSGNDTFNVWSGACSGSGACSVTLSAARTVNADFAAGPRTITILKAGTGTGTVTSAPVGISCGATCAAAFPYNTSVTLTAAGTSGSSFAGWSGVDSGVCAGTVTACTTTADKARTITANFNAGPQTLSVTYAGGGSGTVVSNPAGLNCTGTCNGNFAYGTAVTLTATATGGSTFSSWSGGICSGNGTCMVTMTGAAAVTANFIPGSQTLTVTKTGTGAAAGLVKSSDSSINCGAACSNTYAFNTSVTLTATAGSGDTFNGWGGACSGTGTCTVVMSAAQNVTAQFTAGNRTLTVTTTPGTGGGTVNSSPAGIANCGSAGGTCSAAYTSGQMVTLTAAAATGYSFGGWGGDCSGAATTCTVTMDIARSVTATFTINTYTLTATTPSNGSITSTDAAISCGASCTKTYNYGTSVTLNANPSTGYSFSSWGGSCAGQSNPCVLTMDAAKTATVTFAINTYTLTATAPSNGSITSSDAAISCGANCTKTYNYGSSVVLTANANTGYSFGSWGGSCAGQGNPCTLTMDAAKTATVTFAINTYALTVVASGPGSVTSAPAGINCGATCSATYNYGQMVTLTATDDPNVHPAGQTAGSGGAGFINWTGDCTGSASTCTVSMTQARSVTATFGYAAQIGGSSVTSDFAMDGTPTSLSCDSTGGATACQGPIVYLPAGSPVKAVFNTSKYASSPGCTWKPQTSWTVYTGPTGTTTTGTHTYNTTMPAAALSITGFTGESGTMCLL